MKTDPVKSRIPELASEDELGKMSTEELGRLFPILIVDYDPEWPKLYHEEKLEIIKVVGTKRISRIEHIGSTSVPGIKAKPTIDILLEIHQSKSCDFLVRKLHTIGYQFIYRPENPAPHMMFAKGYSVKGKTGQTFHIHVRYPGDWDELIFRDYLIDNPVIAAEYEELKMKLAVNFSKDREKYTEGKTDFIKHIVNIARMKW